ncbi:MAG: hypothetical protein QW040_01715 [Candidatus Aenigmatarchaeota archaeon]
MRLLKLISIIVTIVCVLWVVYLYTSHIQITSDFCSDLKKGKDLCISYKSPCEATTPQDPISCVARMLTQAGEIDAARVLCSKKGNVVENFCLAFSLIVKGVDSALLECDKISGPEKYHCRGDVWKEVGNVTRGLEECDEILTIYQNDYDSFYKCKASVYKAISKDGALEFCKNITDVEIRKDCEILATV